MRLGRFLAYAWAMDPIQAEEELRWLAVLHPGKNAEQLLRRLRKRAGFDVAREETDVALLTFQTNPMLAKRVRTVDKID